MKSHLFRCLVAATLVVTVAARAVADDRPFFPILIWDSVPNDPAVIRDIAQCGITVCGFVTPNELPLIRQAGMKAIVQDPRAGGYDWKAVDETIARRNVASLVREVKADPAVLGWFVDDEPSAAEFAGLGKVTAAFRSGAPGIWPYINLLPNYASTEQLGTQSYDEYLERFIATCKPSVLSYDHYALMDDGSLRPQFWSNLESIRSASLRHRIPFWCIVLSCAHFNYREPTEADLRFEAYTTLACGGRGIVYFKYFCPAVGNYRAAPIDPFGHGTVTWEYLRRVNMQVLKLAPTVLKLTSTDVYHFGNPPPGTHGPDARSLLTDCDPHFLAGDFRHEDGSDYVMLVNTDLTRSHAIPLKPRAAIRAVRLISAYTGQPIPFEGEQTWAAPGQGVLLKLER